MTPHCHNLLHIRTRVTLPYTDRQTPARIWSHLLCERGWLHFWLRCDISRLTIRLFQTTSSSQPLNCPKPPDVYTTIKIKSSFIHSWANPPQQGDHPLSQCETTSNAQLHDNVWWIAIPLVKGWASQWDKLLTSWIWVATDCWVILMAMVCRGRSHIHGISHADRNNRHHNNIYKQCQWH